MKVYLWNFGAACAYVLVGMWDYFQWRWAYQVGITASHTVLLPPLFGAVWLVVLPLFKRRAVGRGRYVLVGIALAALPAEALLLTESLGRGDRGGIGREALLLLLGAAAAVQTYRFNAERV